MGFDQSQEMGRIADIIMEEGRLCFGVCNLVDNGQARGDRRPMRAEETIIEGGREYNPAERGDFGKGISSIWMGRGAVCAGDGHQTSTGRKAVQGGGEMQHIGAARRPSDVSLRRKV